MGYGAYSVAGEDEDSGDKVRMKKLMKEISALGDKQREELMKFGRGEITPPKAIVVDEDEEDLEEVSKKLDGITEPEEERSEVNEFDDGPARSEVNEDDNGPARSEVNEDDNGPVERSEVNESDDGPARSEVNEDDNGPAERTKVNKDDNGPELSVDEPNEDMIENFKVFSGGSFNPKSRADKKIMEKLMRAMTDPKTKDMSPTQRALFLYRNPKY